MLREKAESLLNDVLDAASMGADAEQPRLGNAGTRPPTRWRRRIADEAGETPKGSTRGNGSRTRSDVATAAAEAGA